MQDRRSEPTTDSPVARALGAILALAALALAIWLLVTDRAGPPPEPEEVEPPAPRVDVIADAPPAPPLELGPEVTRFQADVAARLRADPPREEPLRGPARFRVGTVTWDDARGRPFFRAQTVEGLLDLAAAGIGDVVLPELTFVAPELYLERAPGEALWNYERVLAPVLDEDVDDVGPAARVVASDVRIRDGFVEVRPPDAPSPYTFRDLAGVVPTIVVSAPDEVAPRARVAQLEATVTAPELREPTPVELVDARVEVPDDRLDFAVESLRAAETRVTEARGSWAFEVPGLGLRLDANVENLPMRVAQAFFPDLPPEGTASFRIATRPVEAARTAVAIEGLVAVLEEGTVTGSLRITIGPERAELVALDLRAEELPLAAIEPFTGPLPYAGVVTGSLTGAAAVLEFDVVARLQVPDVERPVVADVTGRLVRDDDGYELRALVADLEDFPLAAIEPLVPGLPVDALVTGRVAVEGPPERAPLTVDVALTVAGGSAFVEGVIDLSGAVPRYELSGRLVGVQLQQLLRPDVPPVALTATFAVAGSGTEPERMNTEFSLAGDFTGWQTDRGDGIRLRGSLADGLLALDTATVALGPADLDGGGRWRFVAPTSGQLRYDLTVASLTPFGPYLPVAADAPVSGALEARGTVSGPLATPRISGTATGSDVVYGDWAAAVAEADYTLELPLPTGTRIDLAASDVQAPTNQTFRTVRGELRVGEQTFTLALDAERDPALEGIVLRVAGQLLPEGRRDARVEELRFELDGGEWVLVAPARVRWGRDLGFVVQGFVLQETGGPGRVAIDGRVPAEGTVRLDADVASVPVERLFELAGREPVLTGWLWGDVRVRGTMDEPTIDGDFRVVQPVVDGIELDVVDATVVYAAEQLRTDVDAVVDTLAADGTLDAVVLVPVRISLRGGPSVQVLDAGRLDGAIDAERFPLSVFDPLSPTWRDPEGVIDGRVTLGGTINQPVLGGRLVVQNGAVTIPALDQRYTEIAATITFEDQRAVIRDGRARSDGWARVDGTVALAPATDPRVDLDLVFDEFRAVGVPDEDDAAVWGEVRVAGPVAAPVITGQLRVDDGAVPIPEIAGPDPLDEEFDELPAAPPEPIVADDGLAAAELEPGPFAEARLDDLQLRAGDDLWFVTENVRVQLGGELTVTGSLEAPTVVGSLRGEQGAFTLIAGPLVRRFDIVSAEVRFFGAPGVSPAIDIEAVRTVFGPDGEPFDVVVALRGPLESPMLSLALPGAPELAESELLSLVLFGQPTFALADEGGPGERVLEEVVVGGILRTAFLEFEEALLMDLGLPFDWVRIQPGPGAFGGFGAPVLVFGTEIADDVFLTINTGVSPLFGGASPADLWGVSIRWRIDPEWTLETGIEPVFPGVFLPGTPLITPVIRPERQFFVDLRRRWTY